VRGDSGWYGVAANPFRFAGGYQDDILALSTSPAATVANTSMTTSSTALVRADTRVE
jgi:hypothetical protein